MSDIARAAEEAIIASISAEISGCIDRGIEMIWTLIPMPSGNNGLIGRSII